MKRVARLWHSWVSMIHNKEEVPKVVAELNGHRRECGRDKEPSGIMIHCPNADGIRRLEEPGVTDLQVTPWSVPGILAEIRVRTIVQQQPPLEVKLESVKRYVDKVIAKL